MYLNYGLFSVEFVIEKVCVKEMIWLLFSGYVFNCYYVRNCMEKKNG